MAKTLSIKDEKEKVDILNSDEEEEIILEDLDEDTLSKRTKLIKQNAENLQEQLDTMSNEEKEIFLEETAQQLGLRADQLKIGPNDNMSDIFKDLSVFVIDQQVKSKGVTYYGNDLVSLRQVPNGVAYKNYNDYTDADELRGDSDVAISDFNMGRNIATGEIFYATKHIHKGYDIMDNMLNDVTKTTALFIELLKDIQKNVALPIAKRIYQYKLQAIASPFGELNKDGIDITSIAPDLEFKAPTLKGVIEKLGVWFKGLKYASRTHTPNAKWKPDKFTNDIEINVSNPKIIAPIEFEEDIKFNVNAGTFQLKEIDALTSTINYFDFKKTFEEYGKVKGLANDREKEIFDLFVMSDDNPVGIIQHYAGSKLTDTPKLKKVLNNYVRLGKEINKLGRIWKVRLSVETTPSEETK